MFPELCLEIDGMANPLYIRDEDIRGVGITEDGSVPPDSRPDGTGWHPLTGQDSHLHFIFKNSPRIGQIVILVRTSELLL